MDDEEISRLSEQRRGIFSRLYETYFVKPSEYLANTYFKANQQTQVQHINTSIPNIMSADNTLYFCIMARLEGKEGTKCIRVGFSTLLDSYENLVEALIERYYPEDNKPVNPDDYFVKLVEVGDEDWPIDIDDTEDLERAVNATSAKNNGFIKISANIRRKTDPPVIMLPPEPAAITTMPTEISVGSSAASSASNGVKRKATVGKKPSPSKRRKSAGSKSALPVRARIIGSIAELRALGKDRAPRIEVALFSGYSNAASKGFSNPLSALKTEGIVEYPDKKTVALTTKGLETEEARSVVPPNSNAEVHSRIKALLTPKQQQIFDLLASDGQPHFRDEVAASVGYTNPASKGYSNSVSKLSSLGLVHYPRNEADPKKKLVQLTDMCFPFAKDDNTPFRAPTPPLSPIGSARGVTVSV